MKFSIPTFQDLKVRSATPRKEKHGGGDDNHVQAITLSVKGTFNNTVLDLFHKSLRRAICSKGQPAPDGPQAKLDLPVSDLPCLTFPNLQYPLRWDEEILGAKFTIQRGTGRPESNIVVNLCTIKDFHITPIEPGLVELQWNVNSSADITPDLLGDLCALGGEDIVAMLELPVVKIAEAGAIDGAVADDGKVAPIKGGKKGLGTDADQAKRQAEVLAQDPSQLGGWPFQNKPPAFTGTPEEAFAAREK